MFSGVLHVERSGLELQRKCFFVPKSICGGDFVRNLHMRGQGVLCAEVSVKHVLYETYHCTLTHSMVYVYDEIMLKYNLAGGYCRGYCRMLWTHCMLTVRGN